mmetsp:Transcript_31054/g.51475  ORF Transcript_31054/g.51475 Transcript_31054/m.51475 type:complete len:424 (+) Transcript_31054:51-1322(+)|eukprot:CAMPEP_0119313982 /NCGR_PEP_ID=MMETSP1333-20130426/31115_1 /TAXON_ID=418940 /ORGANISM="Scyphosphaera apsteinii, Strain RCC1455" /LENGTH=423 /DNA_ID=CAMNT_0007318981 /DNA_START=44 /DNA_END=1315 /DNA_ORIENTATION=+
MSNPLPWSSIEQLPREVCAKLERFFAAADLAARQIQQAHRKCPLMHVQDSYRGGYRARLHELFYGRQAYCSEKLDGTNVGIMADGTLLGRRLVIEYCGKAHVETYQHCELRPLRTLRQAVADCLQELAADAPYVNAALYGELCCNPGLYNYMAAGLAKTWQAFGALIQTADEMAARAFMKHAEARGFECTTVDDAAVRVSNSQTFVALLQRHGVPVIGTEAHGSLCTLVASRCAWMQGEHGEGLVLSLAADGGRTKTYKWKISREPQPAAVSELSELHAKLHSGVGGLATLLEKPIIELVSQLLAVATHVDSRSAQPRAEKKGKGKERATDAAAVQRAIASALTKFDALDATFAAEGKRGVGVACERLLAEILADTELVLPAEGNAGRALAMKEVEGDVKRCVGKAFGEWMKHSAGASAASAG